MIIAVTNTGRVELREAHDFRAFKIIDEQGGAPGQLSASLRTLATLTPDGAAAWVSQDGVRGLLGPEATQHWLSAFEAMIERNEFLEHATIYGQCYGTARARTEQRLAAGRDVILDIDWQGARQIRQHMPGAIGI